jgi:predicted thioesterase
MDYTLLFPVGLSKERRFVVQDEHTALHIGSGSLRVLATPAMIGFMEQTARDLMAERLPAGSSSVGVLVHVSHLAPTPVGAEVTARVEVLSVEKSKVTFNVQAGDAVEMVGKGQHERVVIDEGRFLARVNAKTGAA